MRLTRSQRSTSSSTRSVSIREKNDSRKLRGRLQPAPKPPVNRQAIRLKQPRKSSLAALLRELDRLLDIHQKAPAYLL
ncbi:MAG: hypothetical protein HY791_05520 [Deltaproteobacteria bacterium]|nr:hypothetical protein [Deltaproteobacteria bacterium]